MSNLTQTKQVYDRITSLIRAELVKKGSNAQKLQECQVVLDVAFYMLGWGQFEYLSKSEAKDRIETIAKTKSIDGVSWAYLRDHFKSIGFRSLIDILFFGKKEIIKDLNKSYDVRNSVTHDYKKLPSAVSDVSAWLDDLEKHVDNY